MERMQVECAAGPKSRNPTRFPGVPLDLVAVQLPDVDFGQVDALHMAEHRIHRLRVARYLLLIARLNSLDLHCGGFTTFLDESSRPVRSLRASTGSSVRRCSWLLMYGSSSIET